MNRTETELLKKLSLAFGPSGCEDKVAEIIKEEITPYADEITEDRSGTLIAKYAAKAERKPYDADDEPEFTPDCPDCSTLLLTSHMDEGGFMVKAIDDDGFIKVKALGVRNPMFIAGRNVTVGNEERETIGYFGAKAVHLGGVGDFDSMFIDIGAKDKEEAEKYAERGDFAVFRSDFVEYGENGTRIKGKALNSRIGCYVLITVLRTLAENKTALPYDVYFAFTRGGEIGICGEKTAAKLTSPDLSITVCAVETNDTAGDGMKCAAKIGEGPALSYADRSTVYDRELTSYIMSEAEKHSIKYQIKKSTQGQTGAAGVQRSMSGVKSAAVSVPARYLSTSANTADTRDIDGTVSLILASLTDIR